MKRTGVILIMVLAFCGMAVTTYLVQQETSGAPLICDIKSLSECNVVVTSEYSRVFGIPLAYYGLFFYTIMFVIAAFELVLFNQLLRRWLQMLAGFGILVSIYSVFTQVYLVKALCIYCLTSAFITVLVLILASIIEPVWQRTKPVSAQIV